MNSEKEQLLTKLHEAMIAYDRDDPKRIQHFAKVHAYARLIGQLENLPEDDQFILETAAYLHDIGIHPSEEKYGYDTGRLQEKEGPPEAKKLLTGLGFPAEVAERACWLIAHHHTYTDVIGKDYQILLEADFLVNLFEDGDTSVNRADEDMKTRAVKASQRIFRTDAGMRILRQMFGI